MPWTASHRRHSRPRSSSTLPKGYVDETGVLHRRGVMRLATAADEILPLRDPRVQQNQAYLTVIVLARVITQARHAARRSTPASSKACSPPTSPISSGSTRSSTRAEEPRRRRRRRRAPNGRAAAEAARRWGKPDGLSRGRLYEEMAFIAHHFHWSSETLMHARARRAPALVPRDLAASTARSTARRDDPFAGL